MERTYGAATEFSDVDASGRAADMISYLDGVTNFGAQAKQATFAALELQPGNSVLDVGCGTGDDVRILCGLVGPQGRVAGVDLSQAMVDEARKRGVPGNAEFFQGSATALPFGECEFDAARADRVFQHLADPQTAAREMYRVLKPEGRALLLDPDWETLVVAGSDKALTRRIHRAMADHTADPWAGRNHQALLVRAGFTNINILPVAMQFPYPIALALALNNAVAHARKAEAISTEEAARWLTDLQMAEERGEFVCALMLFASTGRRPA